MNGLISCWNGDITRRQQWTWSQSVLGACVFHILSHGFESAVLDRYDPSIATLITSAGGALLALATLSLSHYIRQSPSKCQTSVAYHIVLHAIIPVILLMCFIVKPIYASFPIFPLVLTAATWRNKLKSNNRFDPETGSPLIDHTSQKHYYHQQLYFLFIAAGYMSLVVTYLSTPMVLIFSCAAGFSWLNASSLFDTSTIMTAGLAFIMRSFQLVCKYNLELLLDYLFIPQKLTSIDPAITELLFWSKLMLTSILFSSFVLGSSGFPVHIIQSFLKTKSNWLILWRINILFLFGIILHILWFWFSTLIPILRTLS